MAVRAVLPTTTSDSLKKTTLGVINSPSALANHRAAARLIDPGHGRVGRSEVDSDRFVVGHKRGGCWTGCAGAWRRCSIFQFNKNSGFSQARTTDGWGERESHFFLTRVDQWLAMRHTCMSLHDSGRVGQARGHPEPVPHYNCPSHSPHGPNPVLRHSFPRSRCGRRPDSALAAGEDRLLWHGHAQRSGGNHRGQPADRAVRGRNAHRFRRTPAAAHARGRSRSMPRCPPTACRNTWPRRPVRSPASASDSSSRLAASTC